MSRPGQRKLELFEAPPGIGGNWFPEADVLGGDVRPVAEHGVGARRAIDRDDRPVDRVVDIREPGDPAFAAVGRAAPAEVAMKHGARRLYGVLA